jgi:hypothetical protein
MRDWRIKTPVSIQCRKAAVVLLSVLAWTSLSAQEPARPSASAERQELPHTDDPKEIVRRSLEKDQQDFMLERDYTYQEREELKVLDKNGGIKHHELHTDDITILYDEPYSRRILKDDKPLTDSDEKKEQDKMDKFTAKYKNESESDRDKRLAKKEKGRQEDRAFAGDVLNAYDFRKMGEEQIDGRDAFVIEASPRKDFHPTQPHADVLAKLRGKLWIDQQDYGWVKMEIETLDTISWGFFVLRIHKGTHMTFEQIRVNDEIWLPLRISVNAGARIALFVNGTYDWESSFSNYKKFSTGTRILPGAKEIKSVPNP